MSEEAPEMKADEYFKGGHWPDSVIEDVGETFEQSPDYDGQQFDAIPQFEERYKKIWPEEIAHFAAVIEFSCGDSYVELKHFNRDHVVFLSVDSGITVLIVIDRKKHKIVFHEESY